MNKRTLWSVGYALAAFVALPLCATAGNDDFVTAGGWITGTPSGAKANFGAAGGIKDGAFWGHLDYLDHGSGTHVEATAVTGYAVDPNDADCRIVDYAVTIDGQAGNARIRVCDKGVPGRNDVFQIQLSNGYFAGGDLGGSQPGGGNVQLHKANASAFAGDGDSVTGGGSITGTPTGTNADFRVSGGFKHEELRGSLIFVDSGNGVRVVSTDITGYAVDPNDADCRIIDFTVLIGTQPGTCRVRVCDKGTSGHNDIFQIQLSNGYFAGGNTVSGNIVLHKKSPPANSPPPNDCDFVTGGGWITGTPSGANGNFGAAGGIKNGAFWGRLDYIDHGIGMHVQDTAVTGYAVDPNDPNCRIVDYDVTIDGQAGNARIRVCDFGDPGENDVFQIQLSNGYFAGGDLGGTQPGGGNVELHRCP
jgi:hypothetical protein